MAGDLPTTVRLPCADCCLCLHVTLMVCMAYSRFYTVRVDAVLWTKSRELTNFPPRPGKCSVSGGPPEGSARAAAAEPSALGRQTDSRGRHMQLQEVSRQPQPAVALQQEEVMQIRRLQ